MLFLRHSSAQTNHFQNLFSQTELLYALMTSLLKPTQARILHSPQTWKSSKRRSFQSYSVPQSSVMAQQATPSSQKALMVELKSLQEQPVEGFRITLVEESDLYNWEVAIFGPPNTLYEGGYFKAHIKFPVDYPYSPPTFRFLTKMWHPNIYENGDVCISILHPPVDDPQSGELPSERWNPRRTSERSCSASSRS
ncbi:hypothetical protein WMY93_031532 [Mugilogobius chulae]|uniref:UBC core domain-containing protein n=1 Tax=Mugilogobius chulae TaxID=88201 RepID=A0AAW0MM46_9GOBI